MRSGGWEVRREVWIWWREGRQRRGRTWEEDGKEVRKSIVAAENMAFEAPMAAGERGLLRGPLEEEEDDGAASVGQTDTTMSIEMIAD